MHSTWIIRTLALMGVIATSAALPVTTEVGFTRDFCIIQANSSAKSDDIFAPEPLFDDATADSMDFVMPQRRAEEEVQYTHS